MYIMMFDILPILLTFGCIYMVIYSCKNATCFYKNNNNHNNNHNNNIANSETITTKILPENITDDNTVTDEPLSDDEPPHYNQVVK